MDIESFFLTLRGLDQADFEAIAARIECQAESAAGEVAWWHATVAIERLVRVQRSGRAAAASGRRAAEAVASAAARSGLSPESAVVRTVARAAAEVARGLVAGDLESVSTLLTVWPLAVAA